MKEKGRLLKDSFIIGATGLSLNLVGLWFNIYLSGTLGTEGIGLFQLIASAYMLATTFATSGINLSVTRVVAEALSLPETRKTATRRFRKCLAVSAALGGVACLLLFVFSGVIARSVLCRPETEMCFRILAFGLPFMSAGSCLNGFFVAERKAYKTAIANGTEEVCKIVFAVLVFALHPPTSLVSGCVGLVLGLVGGEAVSCILAYAFWLADEKTLPRSKGGTAGTVRKMLAIGAPVAASSYLRTGLTTVENLSVPVGLVRYGMTDSDALAAFGAVKSLAVPVIFFPASFMYAFIKVMIPEVARAYTLGRTDAIHERGGHIIRLTLVFSSVVTGIFLVFYAPLGALLFDNAETGKLLLYLAPLIPAMYVDGVADGILKGMDEQVAVMRYNIYEAIIRLVVVFTLIPVLGFAGFMATVYAGNVINTSFSLARLRKKAGIKAEPFGSVVLPTCLTVAAGFLFKSVFSFWQSRFSVIVEVFMTAVLCAAVYAFFLFPKLREKIRASSPRQNARNRARRNIL